MAAQLGTVGDLLPYAYPLFRLPVEASRAVAVHNAVHGATRCAAEVPGAEVARVAMPMAPRARSRPSACARCARGLGSRDGRRWWWAPSACSRARSGIETVARAVARGARALPRRAAAAGGPVPDRARARRGARRARACAAHAIVTGRVPLEELPAHIEVADVVAHLRYPTARETSAALLRVLAQGRPAIVSDLENLADVPDGAVLRADVADEEGEVTRALLRLAGRPRCAPASARRPARTSRRAHSAARCRETYAAAIERHGAAAAAARASVARALAVAPARLTIAPPRGTPDATRCRRK